MRRDFGRWLREQREAGGKSQKFVAAKSGITVTQLSRIENGHSGTRRDTVILLAEIIGVDKREALRRFAPESFPQIPKELENIPFSEFDQTELREIVDFLNFKLAQKGSRRRGGNEGGKPRRYRLKNGKLVGDGKGRRKKGRARKKPAQ